MGKIIKKHDIITIFLDFAQWNCLIYQGFQGKRQNETASVLFDDFKTHGDIYGLIKHIEFKIS